MKITFRDHGGKGARLGAALHAAGHVTVPGGGDIAVLDHDYYTNHCDAHEVVVLYPHGGNVILEWDAKPLHPHVRLALVHGPGHSEVMAAYGFGAPTVEVGWSYSELAEPRYPETVRNVLFAPVHPLGNGYLPAEQAELNRRILAKLLATDLAVSVRIFGPATGYGLDPSAPVRWVPGGSLAHRDIDAADLVVATDTVLALAVARGAPALSLGSDLVPDVGHDGPLHPAHWADYAATLRYPYDVEDDDLGSLCRAVTQPDPAVADWRARFVGGPFDAELAVRTIEAAAEHRLEVSA